jgi:hypothetical protein
MPDVQFFGVFAGVSNRRLATRVVRVFTSPAPDPPQTLHSPPFIRRTQSIVTNTCVQSEQP